MTVGRFGVAVLAVTVAVAGGGCSTYVDGRAVGVPGQTGQNAAPADLVGTTCRQYLTMDDKTRREVIKAIAKQGNQLVSLNPDLWVGIAGALCTFVDPSAPVKDILLGQGMR